MRRPSRPLLLVAGGALAALAVAPAASAAPGPHGAAADPYSSRTGSVTVAGDVLGGLTSLAPTGHLAGSTPVEVGISLNRPDTAGEDAYLADVYDTKSPNYRHFLTPSQWESRFGVSTVRYEATQDFLREHGLAVTSVPGVSDYVLATGAAADVESAFATTLDTFSLNGDAFYANTTAPTVPADLGVLDVVGLESFTRMKTMNQAHASLGAPVGVGTTTPQDLWGIYDQPSSDTGQGQQMAIFGWGVTSPDEGDGKTDVVANLRSFEKTYSLPQAPVTISHYGTDGEAVTDTSGTDEWELDLPASTGMAPDTAGVHLYFGDSGADADIIAAYAAWNGDATGPLTGSSSFAGCEATAYTGSQAGGPGNPSTGGGPAELAIGNPDQDAYEAQLKKVVALGRTMFVSAGDLGTNACPYSFLTALNGATTVPTILNNYPTVSQYVVAVGGTALHFTAATATTPGKRTLEFAWNASGGGTSITYAQPAWQTAAIGSSVLQYPCVQDWHGTAYASGTNCRLIPDVSAQSGDLTSGYASGAGTSLSAPLWNGMWSRIQAASKTSLGFADPLIYANNSNAAKYASDFFDVGNLNNTSTTQPMTSTSAGAPGYNTSSTGWDYITGWGSPDVTNLMKEFDNGNTTPVAANPVPALPDSSAPVALLAAGLAAAAAGAALVRRRRA